MSHTTRPISIFISYALEDESVKTSLLKHLESMRKEGLIQSWDNHQIVAGTYRYEQVKSRLKQAKMILLLISSDAIASTTLFDNEIQLAIERHSEKLAIVLPILIRPCDWTILKKPGVIPLPYNEVPISLWENQDEAFERIAQNLRNLIPHLEDILTGKTIENFLDSYPTSNKEQIARLEKRFAYADNYTKANKELQKEILIFAKHKKSNETVRLQDSLDKLNNLFLNDVYTSFKAYYMVSTSISTKNEIRHLVNVEFLPFIDMTIKYFNKYNSSEILALTNRKKIDFSSIAQSLLLLIDSSENYVYKKNKHLLNEYIKKLNKLI